MTATTHDPARLSPRSRSIIAILLVATFVMILNETIMNVALPKLMVDLSVSANTVQWLSTAFMLTMAVVIPVTGFVLERLGTRTVFLTAMGLFSAGTLVAAVAPGFGVLLVGRIVQACGTAIMLPLLTTAVLGLVPTARRGGVMGTVSIVISVAPAIGPTISGLILEALPWRYLFLVVLPIALVVLAYGARRLVDIGETRATSLDVLSVGLSALGFGGIVYGLNVAGGPQGWGDPRAAGTLAVAAASLALFTWRQVALQRRDAPLLDLRAFRYRMFTLSTLLFMVIMIALFGAAILLPMYLQTVRGFGSLATGLLLLPGGVLMGLMAPPVGRLFDRYGPVALTSAGAALLAVSLWRFTTLSATTPVATLLALHLLLSFGLALLFTPVFATGLNPLPPRLHSHGSAIMSTLQQLAGAAGTALLIAVMTGRTAAGVRQGLSPEAALTGGLHAAFTVATVAAMGALAIVPFLRRTVPDEAEPELKPALSTD